MKKLYSIWGGRVEFVDIIVRQAHPGPDVPAYRTDEQKLLDARRYKQEERIPWTVLADDVEGTTHQTYGALSDPSYLIGADGYVAFYSAWTDPVVLNRAIHELLEQGGRGIVETGISRAPRLAPVMADGWRAIRRGLPQSYIDLETALPGSATSLFVAHQFRSVLQPLADAIEPVAKPAKAAGVIAALAIGIGVGFAVWKRSRA